MICKKCGNNINENSRFCSECGWDTASEAHGADDAAGTADVGSVSSALHNTPANPRQKNKKVLIGALAAALVVLVGIGVLAGSVIKNSFSKMFTSPDEYLLRVQAQNTEKFANSFANQISLLKNNLNMENGASADVKLTFGDDLKKLLLAEADEESAKLANWIDSAGVGIDTVKEDNNIGCKFDVDINDTSLVSADFVMDFTDEAMYVSVPSINPQGIKIPFDEADISPEMSSAMLNAMNRITEIVPDEKVFSGLICDYMNTIAAQIKDVSESEDEITVGAVSHKSTLLTARVDGLTAINIAQSVLNKFAGDKTAKGILADFAEFAGEDGDSITAELETAVAEAVEELEELKENIPSDEVIIIKVWVDSSGNIEGAGMSFGDEAEITYLALEDGKDFASELMIKVPGATASVEGTGNESKGKLNGKYTFLLNDTELFGVTVENYDTESASEGMTNGKFIIEPSSQISGVLELAGDSLGEAADILPDVRLEIIASSSNTSSSSSEIAVYYKDSMFVTLEASVEASCDMEITKPESTVDYTNINSWTQNIKPDSVIEALKSAGAPGELLILLAPEEAKEK